MENADSESDETQHIVSFNETANRSVDLLPSDAEGVESAEEIDPVEYRVYGKRAECMCGEVFDSHEAGLEHLKEVRSEPSDPE